MILNNDNQVNKYDSLIYESGPISVTDYVANKYDKVHAQLYNNALQKYLTEHQEYMLYRSAYNFIEIKQPEYWMPSYVNIISKHYPYEKNKVWLDSYWNKYQNKNKHYSYTYIDEDTIKDAEVIYMNYVTGEATMKSKFTDVEFTVPFSKLNGDTPVSDEIIQKDTFIL